MRVVVASYPGGSDAAHLALTAENIEHRVVELRRPAAYSDLLTRLWRSGEGFVLVEHDVIPWFGAITQLWDCPRDWCMFQYPKIGKLTEGLGCAKFSTGFVAGHPGLEAQWAGVTWHSLDGAVSTAVRGVLHREQPWHYPLCTHTPPLAHIRRLD